MTILEALIVTPCPKRDAIELVIRNHYLHREPPCSYSYALVDEAVFPNFYGVATFGTPASRYLMVSACKSDPDRVIELNRIWLDEVCESNTASWFVSRVLKMLPPHIVVSYADTAHGHVGYLYRALNFHYAGVTDMDRKTPRFDYITPGYHPRETSRNGTMNTAKRIRRKPKHRYWTTTGNRRERRELEQIATWPILTWKETT